MALLRRAEKRDARAIQALIYRVGINPLALDWRRFWVAVDDQDRVIGCGQIKPHGDGLRELASIAVMPEWQGRGIGRMIVLRLLEDAPSPLYLTCAARQEGFYLRFGFATIDRKAMPPYFRRIDTLFQMLRALVPTLDRLLVMRWSRLP